MGKPYLAKHSFISLQFGGRRAHKLLKRVHRAHLDITVRHPRCAKISRFPLCLVVLLFMIWVLRPSPTRYPEGLPVSGKNVLSEQMVMVWWTAFFVDHNHGEPKHHVCNITDESTGHILMNQQILVTENTTLRDRADALLFHGPRDSTMSVVTASQKQQNEVYIMISHEPPIMYQDSLMNDVLLSHFDLMMNYESSSDIYHPFASREWFEPKSTRSFQEKNETEADLCWVGSNCRAWNGREWYLEELFGLIPTDSLGSCLPSIPWHHRPPRSVNITDIISKYKFYIVFENANCNGYISEKLGNALMAGTVPVVWSEDGVPNYEELLPRNSFINAADFQSAAELAAYLKKVGSDEDLYAQYFQYKLDGEPLRKERERTSLQFDNPWCNAANSVYNYRRKGISKGLVADRSCERKGNICDRLQSFWRRAMCTTSNTMYQTIRYHANGVRDLWTEIFHVNLK